MARLERGLAEVLDQPGAERRADESGPGRGGVAPPWRATDLAAERRSPPAGPAPGASARRALSGSAEQTGSRSPVATTRKSWSGAEIGMAIPEDAEPARALPDRSPTARPHLPETPPQEVSHAAPHRIAWSRGFALPQPQSPDPAPWPAGPPPTDVALPERTGAAAHRTIPRPIDFPRRIASPLVEPGGAAGRLVRGGSALAAVLSANTAAARPESVEPASTGHAPPAEPFGPMPIRPDAEPPALSVETVLEALYERLRFELLRSYGSSGE